MGTLREIWKQIRVSPESMATVKTILILLIVTVGLIAVSNFLLGLLIPEMTGGLAIGLLKVTLYLTLVWMWDRFAIPEVDTIKEIKEGNVAYALFICAFNIGLALVCSSI